MGVTRSLMYGAIALAWFAPLISQADSLAEINEELETLRMQRLAQVQADPANELEPFSSDGCSGGMSDGWLYMARIFPSFETRYGSQPPWQECCVEHDRIYWRGETEQGYEKRLDADRALRQCVEEVGRANSSQLAQEHKLDREEVEERFEIAAQLMYRAVRLGGKPCTLFPWRWGYGWPRCAWTLEE